MIILTETRKIKVDVNIRMSDGWMSDIITGDLLESLGKRDDYPTMGTTDTPNRNGYYTSSTLDLSGCKLDYDVIPLYNKYRNE